MNSKDKLLAFVKWSCGSAIVLGLAAFLIGWYAGDLPAMKIISFIGLSMVFSAMMLFIVGVFSILATDMETRVEKGVRIIPDHPKVVQLNKYTNKKRRVSI